MKKICIVFLLVFLILLSNTKTYAFSGEPLERINYLDLANLEYKSWNANVAGTKNSITVKTNTTYTLIMSRNFLGWCWDELDSMEIEYEEPDASNYFSGLLTVDEVNDLAYHTFTTGGPLLDFIMIPVNGSNNYELMLYEGTYVS